MDNQFRADSPGEHRFPVLKVIGTILLMMILVCGGLVVYVANNFRSWTSSLAKSSLVRMVDDTSLPAEQKAVIKRNIDRVADAYRREQMSHTQLASIMNNLAKGPVVKLMIVEAMRYRYGSLHTVMDEERREMMMLLDRFERGIAEARIPRKQIEAVLALVEAPDDNSKHKLKQPASEADFKPVFDAMRKAVDEAGIPPAPFQPDFAVQIDKAVSAVMGPTATGPSSRPSARPSTRPSASQSALPAESMPAI